METLKAGLIYEMISQALAISQSTDCNLKIVMRMQQQSYRNMAIYIKINGSDRECLNQKTKSSLVTAEELQRFGA